MLALLDESTGGGDPFDELLLIEVPGSIEDDQIKLLRRIAKDIKIPRKNNSSLSSHEPPNNDNKPIVLKVKPEVQA